MKENENAKHLKCLLGISHSPSAPLEVEKIFQSITTLGVELTARELVSGPEYKWATRELYFAVTPWFHREALRDVRVPLNSSIAGWVNREAKQAIFPDAKDDPFHHMVADQATDFNTCSILAVPFIYRVESIGVMGAVNKTGQAHYGEDDLAILETLAGPSCRMRPAGY